MRTRVSLALALLAWPALAQEPTDAAPESAPKPVARPESLTDEATEQDVPAPEDAEAKAEEAPSPAPPEEAGPTDADPEQPEATDPPDEAAEPPAPRCARFSGKARRISPPVSRSSTRWASSTSGLSPSPIQTPPPAASPTP